MEGHGVGVGVRGGAGLVPHYCLACGELKPATAAGQSQTRNSFSFAYL